MEAGPLYFISYLPVANTMILLATKKTWHVPQLCIAYFWVHLAHQQATSQDSDTPAWRLKQEIQKILSFYLIIFNRTS